MLRYVIFWGGRKKLFALPSTLRSVAGALKNKLMEGRLVIEKSLFHLNIEGLTDMQ